MRRRSMRLASVLMLLSLLLLTVPTAATGAGAPAITAAHVPEVVLVKFTPAASEAAKGALLKQHGLTVEGKVWGSEVHILRGAGKSTAALIQALSNNPNIEYAEPDYIASIGMIPNDPSWSSQWGPAKISAPAAWDITQGSATTLIAVVDTGVDLDHPDLDGKVRTDIDWDFVNNDATAQDDNGHGTHVAGIAAAETNNSTGIAGLCPNCQVLPVKVLNRRGSGSYSGIASGVNYAVQQGAKVINLSLGGSSDSQTLRDAIASAGQSTLLACAAGNSGSSAPSYPAYYADCVAVAATDQNDNKASFSNYGTWVDTSAPGVSIYATYYNNKYSTLSGTSMAAPHVAGLAGLLFSQGRSLAQVKTRLTDATYTDPVNSTLIPRRINAFKAVSN